VPSDATISACGGVLVTTDDGDRTILWFSSGNGVPDEWQGQRVLQGEFRRRLDTTWHGEFRSGDVSVELRAGTIECG
jgi:hypothetical protein